MYVKSFIFVTWSCVVISVLAKDVLPKEYIINLDLPADQRWNIIMKDFKSTDVLGFQKIIDEYVPKEVQPLLFKIVSEIDKYLPENYVQEINGIARVLGVPVGEAAIPNFIYDLTAFCTGIVAQDVDGVIWHGRNLDYPLTDFLKNITITVHFQRQAKTLYTATTYAGFVGILTGQKPGVFTISVNERDSGAWWMNALMAILDRRASLVSFLVRDTLEEAQSFDSAVHQLGYTDLIAPVYYIVGGTKQNQGAVITRDRLAPRDLWYLNVTEDRWFLVETNYDHWLPPPKHDDRRTPAIKAMNNTGQKRIGSESLFKVMSTPPILNSITTYTTILSAANPQQYKTWIRNVP